MDDSFVDFLGVQLDLALSVSGMDSGGIYVLNDAGGLDLLVSTGLSEDFLREVSSYGADSARTRLVLEGKPVYTVYTNLGFDVEETEKIEAISAIAVVPVKSLGEVVGCMNLASHTICEIPDDVRKSVEKISARIGGAITDSKN